MAISAPDLTLEGINLFQRYPTTGLVPNAIIVRSDMTMIAIIMDVILSLSSIATSRLVLIEEFIPLAEQDFYVLNQY